MIIRILAGIILSGICAALSFKEAERALVKRDKDLSATKREKALLVIFSAIAGAAIMYLVPVSAETIYLFILLFVGEAIAITDIKERIIPNELTLSVIAVTLVFGIPGLFGAKGFPSFSLKYSLLGFAACMVIFLLPSLFKKNVGAGDVKLAAAMGFCLGFWNSMLGIVLMGILVLVYTFMQKELPMLSFVKSFIPMGPFLSCSMVTVLLCSRLPMFAGFAEFAAIAGV